MKKLLLLFILVSSNFVFGQTYNYTFEGSLDNEQLRMIEEKCLKLPQVTECKVKYKPESKKGEILIYIDQTESDEGVLQFSPIDVKNLLITLDLIPGVFFLIHH